MPNDNTRAQDPPAAYVFVPGVAFAVLFTAAFAALADLLGSFADSNETYIEHYDRAGSRAQDIAGTYLLTLAGLAFSAFGVGFAHRLKGTGETVMPTLILSSAVLCSAGMLVAAALLGTVSLSRTMGNFFDETGVLVGGEAAVLPQAGAVVMAIPVAISASAAIAAMAYSSWGPHVLPRWICVFGFIAALVIVLLAFSGPPLLLLPAWVLAVSIAVARANRLRGVR